MPDQDWFAANAPKPSAIPPPAPTKDDDWFAANAPKQSLLSWMGDAAGRFAEGVAKNNPITTTIDFASDLYNDPKGTAQRVLDASGRHIDKAKEAYRAGQPLQSLGHAAAAVPLIGPALADIKDQAESGDVAGAMGAAAMLGGGERLVEGAGRGARALGTGVYEAGLGRTKAMRRAFPDAAKIGVEQRIFNPSDENLQRRLDTTEQQLRTRLDAHDNARPTVAGLLPEASGEHVTDIPLSDEAPLPNGASAVIAPAAAVDKVPWNQMRQKQGRSSDPNTADTIFGGEAEPGSPQPTADDVAGPGVLRRKQPFVLKQLGGGAPPTMVDPAAIAAKAKQIVAQRAGLIDPEEAGGAAARGNRQTALRQLDALESQFVAENSRPLTTKATLSLKRGQQDLATTAYLKAERGTPINDIKALWDQATAEVSRDELLRQVPAAEGELRTLQGLLGLRQASRNVSPLIPGTDLSALRKFLVEHPAVMSTVGITADKIGQLLQNPKLANAVRAAMLAEHSQDGGDQQQ